MAHTKLYTWIFVVLFAFATLQALVEVVGILDRAYWLGLAAIIVLSAVKAVLVAGYYQHLRWEPSSVSYLAISALTVVLALTGAAAFSIL
jgi:cytochrome c oxidase subunit 4